MDPLLVSLVWAVAAGFIGARKGEGTLAFIAGMLFGPLGVLVAAASSGRRAQSKRASGVP